MNLYTLHDNARRLLGWEETTSMAIWANDPAEAVRLYRKHYVRVSGADGPPNEAEVVCKCQSPPASATVPVTPGIEDSPRVQRELGWRFEDESTCDTCGLAAMDLPEFRVCGECYQCLACGHDDECSEEDEE